MKKVEVLIDPEVESHYPRERGSLIEIQMIDGSKALTSWVHHALGEPENPLPLSVTQEKFREVASDVLTKKTMDRVETLLDVSRTIDSAKTLFDALSEEKIDESRRMEE